MLPSSLGQPATGVSPQEELPRLIQKQNEEAEGKGEKPILHRDRSRPNDRLKLGDVGPENRHTEREQHGREELQVPGLLVEDRGLLEDAPPPGAYRE